MANVIKLRKGLDINLKGKAAETYATVKEPGFYALVPDDFPGVTPKVVVKEQEYVMAGGPLFIDKNHPEVKFVSPVSGVVTSVERGARRKVLNIVVEAAAEQDYEEFGKKNVASMDADAVKTALLKPGFLRLSNNVLMTSSPTRRLPRRESSYLHSIPIRWLPTSNLL